MLAFRLNPSLRRWQRKNPFSRFFSPCYFPLSDTQESILTGRKGLVAGFSEECSIRFRRFF